MLRKSSWRLLTKLPHIVPRMASVIEIVFAGIAGLGWLVAMLFFVPWQKDLLDKMDEAGRNATELVDLRSARLFSSVAALCSAIAAFSHIVARLH